MAEDEDADGGTGEQDEDGGEGKVGAPRDVAQVAAEDGKETKDFDGEEGEGEDVLGARQAGGEHGRGHERGVGGERGGKLCADAAAVVEEEDMDDHQPAGHGPDRVARRRAR